jgi:recombination protein RecR
MQNFSSKLLENAVNQIAKLPGIGYRTAVRLAIFLLQQPEEETDRLTEAIHHMRHGMRQCRHCHNLSDEEECEICRNPARNPATVCVVQDIRDVIAIEKTEVFHGRYHVLGGVISPMNGIGPSDLQIGSLWKRLHEITELILALPATTEGDTTAYYIYKHAQQIRPELRITTIPRGLSVGDELEYADEATLGRSLLNRIDFQNTFSGR